MLPFQTMKQLSISTTKQNKFEFMRKVIIDEYYSKRY